MAYEDIFRAIGWWIAAADLRTHQYKFVKLDANQKVALCSVAGELAVGVLQNKPDINRAATIATPSAGNVTKVVASAAIAMMAAVSTAADGRAKTAIATEHILGIALAPAAAAGEIISILLLNAGKV